jgi:hypothetical protein
MFMGRSGMPLLRIGNGPASKIDRRRRASFHRYCRGRASPPRSGGRPVGRPLVGGKLILYGCGDVINDYEGISGHEQFRGDLGAGLGDRQPTAVRRAERRVRELRQLV